MSKTKNLVMVSSDSLDDSLQIDTIINKLNDYLTKIKNETSTQKKEMQINALKKQLKSWQIISAKPENERIWVQTPFIYKEWFVEKSLFERITHLFKTGVWLTNNIINLQVYVKSNTLIPFTTNAIKENDWGKIQNDTTYRFIYAVELLKINLETLKEKHNVENAGIFESPQGIVAMNQSKYWLTTQEKGPMKSWNLKHTLETHTLFDLINNINIRTENKLKKE